MVGFVTFSVADFLRQSDLGKITQSTASLVLLSAEQNTHPSCWNCAWSMWLGRINEHLCCPGREKGVVDSRWGVGMQFTVMSLYVLRKFMRCIGPK